MSITNLPEAYAWVEERSSSGSDHYIVTSFVQAVSRGPLNLGKFVVTLRKHQEWATLIVKLLSYSMHFDKSIAGVDSNCLELGECLKTAFEAIGYCARATLPTKKEWWNKKCDVALKTGGKTMTSIVQAVRKEYYKKEVGRASGRNLWKVIRWRRNRRMQIPTITLPSGKILVESSEKALYLHKSLCSPCPAEPGPRPAVKAGSPLPLCTLKEVTDAYIRISFTSPSPNSLTVRLLKLV